MYSFTEEETDATDSVIIFSFIFLKLHLFELKSKFFQVNK